MKPSGETRSFLLEIGVEELPSDAIRAVRERLEERVRMWLADKNLIPDKGFQPVVAVEVTPRRIVLFLPALPLKQSDCVQELIGPSWKSAFGENGEPSPALLGFLKAKGAQPGDVFKKTNPRGGESAAVRLRIKGERTEKALKTFLPDVFSGFPFPKLMRWRDSVTFPRPIRSLLALFGREVLPLEYAGLRAGRTSRGHAFLAPQAFALKTASLEELTTRLKRSCVILSFEERSRLIRRELLRRNPQEKIDSELIQTSAALVEDVAFIYGTFEERFLALPEEVLVTSMRTHQRIFALYDRRGKLLPKFLAVVNGKKARPELIRKNYENVLGARLKDAEFFFAEDTKSNLEEHVERLGKVTFLGRLGTLLDKTKRLRGLATVMAEEIRLGAEDYGLIERAALLSKADLVTHMVYEFPELQGFTGSEYARRQGEPEAVCRALRDHYLPVTLQTDDPLRLGRITAEEFRKTRWIGVLLGILDKLDTLVGAYGIGLEPTGSEDPYALRRAANGIVQTVLETGRRYGLPLDFSMEKLIHSCAGLYEGRITVTGAPLVEKLRGLFEERLLWALGERMPRDREFLKGIFASQAGSDRLSGVLGKFVFLRHLESNEPLVFYKACKILERAANIVKGAGPIEGEVEPGALAQPEEKDLFEHFSGMEGRFRELAAGGDYQRATALYAETLYDRIHAFFDRVLVNVEDESLRRNRLALMRNVKNLYTQQIADLSIVTQVALPEGMS